MVFDSQEIIRLGVVNNLKIIADIVEHKKSISRAIKKYGYFAEHNYMHYLYNESGLNKNIVFDFGCDKVILSQLNKKNNVWSLFPNGILAPESERLDLLFEATNYILKKQKVKKFVVEVSEDIRNNIIKKIKKRGGFKACNVNYILYWPVYDMNLWSPKLKGRQWKKLRNIRNQFYKNKKVQIRDSKDISKEELSRILFSWLKKRSNTARVKTDYYLNLINNDFKGFDMAKTICVNGKPSTITAGWKIPNTNNYYSSIGILDYSYPGLGEVANIDDLNRLKRQGFDHVDFGGSEKALLYFKKKFRPEKIYKTYIFSIVRR